MTAHQPRAREQKRVRSRSTRIALALVGALSVWVAGASTTQILGATFATASPSDEPCRAGARRLLRAVERARGEASGRSLPEREALASFRADVRKDFDTFTSVQSRCALDGDQSALRALRSIELLRYAEESAVRYSAVDLTRFRRKTPQLVEALSDRP